MPAGFSAKSTKTSQKQTGIAPFTHAYPFACWLWCRTTHDGTNLAYDSRLALVSLGTGFGSAFADIAHLCSPHEFWCRTIHNGIMPSIAAYAKVLASQGI